MEKTLSKVKHFIDRILPYALVVLLILILLEIFFKELIQPYETIINIIDHTIVAMIAADLYFKWRRSHGVKNFLKSSWLDIIAVFPFFIVIRVLEEAIILARITDTMETFDNFLEIERDSIRLAREVEKEAKVSRTSFMKRFLKPFARSPRFAKAFTFYERPHVKIHKMKEHKK
jgi:hypothetical protein